MLSDSPSGAVTEDEPFLSQSYKKRTSPTGGRSRREKKNSPHRKRSSISGSQTMKPTSKLMTYEEALDILIAGPPDHGDDEIFANDGEEEADSHYTPQIVKLLAGKCNIKWEWTTQDLETPHGSKRNARLFKTGKPVPVCKPIRGKAFGRWVVTALIDVQETLDPKTVKTAGKGEIKCLAALPTTTIAEVSEQLGGMAGPLLAPSQQANEKRKNDEWCKTPSGAIIVPHSAGGVHEERQTRHPLFYKDFDDMLHGSSAENADGQLNPKLSLTDYNIGVGGVASNGLWSRTLHHCSINGAIAAVPECKQGSLDLSSRGLQEIPEKVWALRDTLSVLNLSDNRLEDLDENEVAQIVGLRALLLGENRLTKCPDCIDELVNLRVLQLSNNRIPSIVPELSKNHLLTMLCIDGNELTELPDELETLTGLTHFLAHENCFIDIPRVIFTWTNLQELYLQGNQLEHLPGDIGENLTKLNYLDLAGNRIATLPAEIGNLKRLDVLSLSANMLLLEGIPWQLGMLTDLKKLYMHGNTKLKKEPPAVSRLIQCGSLVECELGLQTALKNAVTRRFSTFGGATNLAGIATHAFKKYDSDGSKCIDYMEFKAICVDLGLSLTKAELKDAMEHLDENHDGTIGEGEFINWFVNR
jgi:Leucine-rich repeat (LRR) protein